MVRYSFMKHRKEDPKCKNTSLCHYFNISWFSLERTRYTLLDSADFAKWTAIFFTALSLTRRTNCTTIKVFKMTGHSKIKLFCRVFPVITRLFCYITCTFKRPSLRLFWLQISQFVPFLHIFDKFCGFLIRKGTNCAILNINNRRLRRLKVHVI